MTVQIGQQVGNHRLIRLIGRGGFAEVYLGEHIQNKTLAAVKVLKTQSKNETDLKDFVQKLKEFINEASTFNLKHPNIVQLLAFGIGKDDTPFLVIDYAPNGSLRDYHRRGVQVPSSTVVSYVKQIAAALQYAHDQKRIHRDVKPENILLGSNNEVLLSDFGIATFAHSTNSWEEQKRTGTLVYMAPEQIQRKAQPASDQYSLAVMVYEWLCGTPPFSGDFVQLMYQHLEVSPPPLREKIPSISPEIEQVVMTALAKDPHQRFENVQAFANALEQACIPPTGNTIYMYHGHKTRIKTVIWSPDSTRIVSVSEENLWEKGSVQIWNATNGNLIYTFHPDYQDIVSVMPFPKTMYIASGKHEFQSNVQIFDANTGHTIISYRYDYDTLVDMIWSPNGKYIASILGNARGSILPNEDGYEVGYEGFSINKIDVRDAISGATVSEYTLIKGIEELTFAWSPDSTRIAFVHDGKINIWNVTVRREVIFHPGKWTYPNDLIEVITYPIKSEYDSSDMKVAWSPDGKYIAFGTYEELYLWGVSTSDNAFSLDHAHLVTALAWSPDSRYIVSASINDSTVMGDYERRDNRVYIWDTIAKKSIYTYSNHSGEVTSLAWSPDAKYIASASEDGTVRIWQAL